MKMRLDQMLQVTAELMGIRSMSSAIGPASDKMGQESGSTKVDRESRVKAARGA